MALSRKAVFRRTEMSESASGRVMSINTGFVKGDRTVLTFECTSQRVPTLGFLQLFYGSR